MTLNQFDSQSRFVDVYKHPNDFPLNARSLFDNIEKNNVEFGIDWHINFIDTVIVDKNSVYFYVLGLNNNILAILPVYLNQKNFGCELHSINNFYTSLYTPIFNEATNVQDVVFLLNKIKENHKNLIDIRFEPLDFSSDSSQILVDALRKSNFVPHKFFCFGNWYLPCNMGWNDYYATRDSLLRHTIVRMGKKFAKAGGTLEVLTAPSDIGDAIAAYNAVYGKSWKRPEPYPDYIPGLIRMCAKRGWLRLGLAWLNGKPVAAQVWIVANGRAEIYKLAYDEQFKAYAPGTLLSALLMQHVIDVDKVQEVDYLIGDEEYKKNWMSHRRERHGLVAYNPSTIFGVIGLLRELLWRAIKSCITLFKGHV